MLSVTVDNGGSPKKRPFSRGISEDDSLRSFIKEAESSSRRLTRSDSRAGTLKRRPDSQQSDQELFVGLPEMLELQASYDEALHELRGLEVEREALLFQVDVLQDTLEGVEELLAEAQREARDAHLELERERDARRKLESLVCSLMQKMERLKEERNTKDYTGESEVDAKRTEHPMNGNAKEDASLFEAAPTSKADEGSVTIKMRWVADSAPSLALNSSVLEDGVHRRPYKSCTKGGRDPSPDKSDSDTASTYEDAPAETPDQEHIIPGDTMELPHDSTTHQVTNEYNTDSIDSQEAQNSENCVVS